MTTKSKLGSIALVFVVGLALMAGPALAAAPTVDTETTDTSTTSDLTDGTTVTGFEAASDNYSYIEASFDSQNASVKVIDPDSGDVIASNDSDAMEQTAALDTDTSGTNDTWYYAWNMSHDELATMPMDAGENKSVTVQFVNDTSLDNPDMTNITVYLENTNDRAVVRAGSTATETGLADIDEDSPGTLASLVGAESENISTVEGDNVGINGSQTEVLVVYADSEVAEPYETAAEDKKTWFGLSSSSYSAGDQIQNQVVIVEDHYYGVYSESVPDAATDVDSVTHATYETVNGEPAHRISLGDSYEDESSIDVETKGNADAPWNADMTKLETDDGILPSL